MLQRNESGPVRARDLGIPFAGSPGPLNAIVDVPGVRVGYATIIEDLEPDALGSVAVRTGVTAILHRPRQRVLAPTWAGASSFNGNGEMTGTHWIAEAGWFRGPVLLTNTHSLGIVHQASLKWLVRQDEYDEASLPWLLPVVAETCDAHLNDMNGFHVTEEHVFAALSATSAGPVAEGNVGGGTGMRCYGFKGGTGTSSRSFTTAGRTYTLGVLVQTNFGRRGDLRVLGDLIGYQSNQKRERASDLGSIVVIAATDMPLLPSQLQRIARRCTIGMGRTGTPASNGSGDIFLAFSTAEDVEIPEKGDARALRFYPGEDLDPAFAATADAVEEAIINALVAAETMVGHRGRRVEAIDHAILAEGASHVSRRKSVIAPD